MFRKQISRITGLLWLAAGLVLSGCASWLQPAQVDGSAPTPVVSIEEGGIENPDIYVDLPVFQSALAGALAAGDTQKLEMWMAEPFFTGVWRGESGDKAPEDALKELYRSPSGAANRLVLVKNVNLSALMGEVDPFSIPGGEEKIVDAFLVSGWGMDGRDEAILFVTRQADNSLKWRGYLEIKGGFSGARFSGLQYYENKSLGFSLYLPETFEVNQMTENYVTIYEPLEGGGHPGGAYITVEPAMGRTSEQIAGQAAETARAELGLGNKVSMSAPLAIDDAQAYIVYGMSGQDPNRQLYVVHKGQLYHILFMPDDPQSGDAYRQMEDIYAFVTNTFHFIR